MKRFNSILLLLLVFSLLSCSAQPARKEKEISMKPNKTDPLQPLMAKTQVNVRYLIYGLINFDKVKIERTSENLTNISYFLKDNMPPHKSNAAEWEEMCDRQSNFIADIRQQFLEQSFTEASQTFGKLLNVCVDCHKIYRYGKTKAKIAY